jgi:thiosulfate/3-mercaptopyruvate sulfurtransferase
MLLLDPGQLALMLAAQRRGGAWSPPGPTRLVVVDCRHDLSRPEWGRMEYAAAHIPGAAFAHLDRDLAGPVTPQSGRHPLPDRAALAAFLGSIGVDSETMVVAYDQDRSMYAARLWWLLRWLGHEHVAILDGGWAAWREWDLPAPVSNIPASPQPREFIARPALVQAVTTAEVQRDLATGRILLLDARAPDRFAGQNETIDPVAGHVPGARNQPFALNLDGGRLRPVDALTGMWRGVLGDTPPERVVVMCGSGVTACHDLLAMELAGLPGARLYAGSWSEWIRDPARKVATGPA